MGPEMLLFTQIAGTALSTFSEMQNASAQEDIANEQARLDTARLEAEMSRERAQAAIDARNREERLRAALGRQRAAMGGIVELSSGTPFRLQETAQSAANREASNADLISNQNLLNLNLQQADTEINRIGNVNAAKNKKTGAFLSGSQSIGESIIRNKDLLKI